MRSFRSALAYPIVFCALVASVTFVCLASRDTWAVLLVVGVATILLVWQQRVLRDARRRARSLAATLRERARHLRESEAALVRAQRFEALGQMTAGVAHDFNNLLAVVSSSAEFLRRRFPERTNIDIDAIDRAVVRGCGLTDQLMSFAGKQPRAACLFHVNRLVLDAEPLLRRLAGRRCALVMEMEYLDHQILADPVQVEQLVFNLVANARDATPDGGRITVTTSLCRLSGHERIPLPPGRYVLVAVDDSGEGMPAEVAARALEPFFTTKKAGKGTGLGLPTCNRIVRSAGGHLVIRSREGQGTSVRAYFPAHDGAAPPRSHRDISPWLPLPAPDASAHRTGDVEL